MKLTNLKRAGLAGVAALAISSAQALAADSATLSLWVGPKHPVAAQGYDPMVARLEGAGFDVKYFQGGALLGAKPTLGGLRDGIADIGMLAMTYFPAEFPNAQVVADMGLSTPNNMTAMLAMGEYNLLHCPDCLQEYYDQNIVYTGTYATSPYTIISKTPIKSLADLAGKKMRVPGSLWSRWADRVGGVQVNMPSSEMFEGLDKGALDIAIQAAGALRSYSLWDTAKYVTQVNLGTYHSLSLVSVNRDFWRDLSADQRAMILDAAMDASIGATQGYTDTDEEVLAAVGDHGVEIIPAPEDIVADKAAFVEEDTAVVIDTATNKYKIADAAAKVATLKELIAKWEAIVADADGDLAKIKAAYKAEVFDKLPADYGL